MNRRRWYIGIFFIAITLLYIWSNSIQSTSQSNEQSKRVLEVIEEVFRTESLNTEDAQHIVRKAAHVAEFALLGLEMSLLLFATGKMCRKNTITILFIGLASAVMDETIQVFSQRGSQVIDIWIDFAGLISGIGIGLSAFTLLHRAFVLITTRERECKYFRVNGNNNHEKGCFHARKRTSTGRDAGRAMQKHRGCTRTAQADFQTNAGRNA